MTGPGPLKIVHVYNVLDPANGGPPHVIRGLVAGQQALGHDVRLISSDPENSQAVDEFLGDYLDHLPKRFVVQPRFFVPVLTRKTLLEALEGADVAHLHGIWPVVTLLAAQMCRTMGIPYVLAPHGSLHAGALGEKRLKKLVGMWTLGYRQLIARASAIHALNEEEASGAVQPAFVGVRLPERAAVIPNGIFPAEFIDGPDVDVFRRSVTGLNDAPYVLFLSRLHQGKGCDLLGEAFGYLARERPDIHLVAVGQDQGAATDLKRAAHTMGFTDRLHLTGPIFDERKHAAYRGASLFCLPSRHEGFSMAITEALAWSTPVVVSRKCHFPLVTEARCGVETSLEPRDIARAMLHVLSNPSEASDMGRRGKALVEARFTWPRIAEQTIELYREIKGGQ